MNVSQNRNFKNIYKIGVLSFTALSLVVSGFSIVSAQDSASVTATGAVGGKVDTKTPRKDFMEAKKEIHTEAKMERKDIRAAATSTRRNIMQETHTEVKDIRAGSKDTRKNIIEANKGDRASTTEALRANRASTTEAIKAVREGRKEDLMKNRASTTEAMRTVRASSTELIKSKRADLMKEIEKVKGDKKKRLDGKKQAQVEKVVSSIYGKLNERITRLNKVDATVTAKITELTTKGTDTATASALLVTAQTSLAKAKVDIQATASLIHEQTATSTNKEVLKGLAYTAEASVKAAAQNYKKVAESIKLYLPEITASTSASVTQ